ncbi:MAG: peptidylprolyl isomerase [Prosthecobacter sp.]
MSISLRGFPWRYALYFLVACYLFMDLYACKGPLHSRLMSGRGSSAEGEGGGTAAEVYGRALTRLELEEGMRAHLWLRHEDWSKLGPEARRQVRWTVLENLVNDRIIRAFRIMNGLDTVPPLDAAKRESDFMRRQFADEAQYPSRLAAMQETQQSLDEEIRDAQLDEQWIAEKIAHRLAEVSETDARAWYDDYRETLRIPAAYHAAHLFLTRHDTTKPNREAELKEIQSRLDATKGSFAELVARYSEDERTKLLGGDLGWFTRERMPADFIEAVEKLPPGQVGGPFSTKLGWHWIVVKERRESRVPEFDEVRDEILALLTSQRREAAVKSLVGELRRRSQVPTQFVFYHAQVIDLAEPAP